MSGPQKNGQGGQTCTDLISVPSGVANFLAPHPDENPTWASVLARAPSVELYFLRSARKRAGLREPTTKLAPRGGSAPPTS